LPENAILYFQIVPGTAQKLLSRLLTGAQVRQEQVSGGVLMALLGLELANIYQNLTNIVLTITPKAYQTVPAVLVNGHFDSAIGSPGRHTNARHKVSMLESCLPGVDQTACSVTVL